MNPSVEVIEGSSHVLAPLADQTVVETQASELATIWHEDREYPELPWPAAQQQLQQLMPWAITVASATFPLGTGLGADNISPRAISRLSAAAVAALATIFMAFEANGSWCKAQ